MKRAANYGMVSALALMTAGPAWAQAEPTPAEPSSSEEIVVTSQKREQKLVKVPAAITAISGKDMTKRGIQTVQDLSFNVPGLTMREDGPGSYTIFMRGLANPQGSGALVGMYLDEAPLTISGSSQLSPATLDYARVEVLKGPQGTLYGQGSAAGTIRFITNKPNLSEFGGSISGEMYAVSHGSVGGRITGVVNVPLVTDKLALRVAGSFEDGGGWIDQPAAGIKNGNETRLTNLRFKLLWQPNDNFSAQAMVQLHRATTPLGLGFEEPDRTVAIGPNRAKLLIPKIFNYDLYNLELKYNLGFADIVSATTYVDNKDQYPFTYIPRLGNFQYGYVEGNDARYGTAHMFAQELRLASSNDGPFHWTIGGFFASGGGSLNVDYEYKYAPLGNLPQGGGFLVSNQTYLARQSAVNYALFADASYDITDRLTIGAGVRYFHDSQRNYIQYGAVPSTEKRGTFSSVDPRAYISYRYADNAQVYASYSEGFRSGGFNSAPFGSYGPEDIRTYELGTKGVFWNGKLQFDIALFQTDYNDMIRRRLVNVNGQFLAELSNIGEVRSRGIEFGLMLKPVEGLTLMANGAYIDSKVVATDAADQVNIPGDRTDYSPRFSYTLSAEYRFRVDTNVDGFVRIDYSHRDKVTYIDRSSFAPSVLPQTSDDLDLVNLRAGTSFNGVDLEVYIQNAADENDAVDPYVGWSNSNRTRPRVVGMKLGYSF